KHQSLLRSASGWNPLIQAGLSRRAGAGRFWPPWREIEFVLKCNPDNWIARRILVNRPKQPFDLGTLGSVGRQSHEQVPRGLPRIGAAAKLRVSDREIEPRLMKIRIGRERRRQRRNRASDIAARRPEDPEIRQHCRILRLEPARL